VIYPSAVPENQSESQKREN